MAHNTWRVLYVDLKLGTVQGELPIGSSFSFSDVLNDTGSFSITMPLLTTTDSHLTNEVSALQITAEDIAPATAAVYFERGGTVVWGGIVWGVSVDVAANSMTLSGSGFLSYFAHRFIRITADHDAVDQLDIARDLIDAAQVVPHGSINVTTTDTNTSGITRDRTYRYYELHNVAETLRQLANVEDGFDFRFDSFRDSNGDIETAFRVTYPATGRATNFIFELTTNAEMISYQTEGSALTNTVDAVGSGEGVDMLIQTVSNTASLADKPLLESVISHTDVVQSATLLEHANRASVRGAYPNEDLTLAVLPGLEPAFGSYIVGDRVRVRGSYGYLDFDNGLWRIMAISVQLDSSGKETVSLSLAPGRLFS